MKSKTRTTSGWRRVTMGRELGRVEKCVRKGKPDCCQALKMVEREEYQWQHAIQKQRNDDRCPGVGCSDDGDLQWWKKLMRTIKWIRERYCSILGGMRAEGRCGGMVKIG